MGLLAKRVICAAVGAALAVGLAVAAPGDGAPFGQRDPAVCEPLMQDGPPSVEQAIQLVRCEREVLTAGDELWLMEEMDLAIDPPVHWATLYNEITMPNSDPAKPVYPIRGSFVWTHCRTKAAAGENNCTMTQRPAQRGVCWPGTLKGWQCFLLG